MKKAYILIICCCLGLACLNAYGSKIQYNVANLGGSQYEYEYAITNDSLAVPIEEFTIWFDVNLYNNLIITTQEPLTSQWDQIILHDTGFSVPIGYDALSQSQGILPLETLNGFSVTFDWLGTGTPSSQFFEIVNPITFETIDSGYTIPEPTTLMLVTLGGCALIHRSRK